MAMRQGQNPHYVVPDPTGGWNFKRSGTKGASSHHGTGQKAIEEGRERSRTLQIEQRIHNRDGMIGGGDRHGHEQ